MEAIEKEEEINWEGDWHRHTYFQPGITQIDNVSDTSFDFIIDIANGANPGHINGTVTYKDNTAIYEKDDYDCEITFTHHTNHIELQTTYECLNYAGNGAYFEGEFYDDKQPKSETTLVTIGVFEDEVQDATFRKLVRDDYIIFLDHFHLRNSEENHDSFDAIVNEGFIQGLGTINHAIIMINEDHLIWAATLVGDDIFYYTNDPEYKNTLPKTIAAYKRVPLAQEVGAGMSTIGENPCAKCFYLNFGIVTFPS